MSEMELSFKSTGCQKKGCWKKNLFFVKISKSTQLFDETFKHIYKVSSK